ncbi:unnamed protein product [Lasius platythorax]|uniref:Myb/SANT-like DNA-binding domain-containing protein n=1 Tax=Lasius platythorax TaxID=488582 RepID=A0AAV2NNF9_9HYME
MLIIIDVVWTKDATLALLSLYESKKNMLNNPKKKVEIWEAISNGLMDFRIKMSCDQIRWKFNALTKKNIKNALTTTPLLEEVQ